jgi:hypothetical protein
MDFNLVAAIVAGLVGTGMMTVLMGMAPQMGMPKMDIVGLLGSMFGAPANRSLGLALHLMMGAIFGIVYALLFPALGGSIILLGLFFGIAQWLIVGLAMGMIPTLHAGIRSGQVSAPGVYMMSTGGMMSFMGGLLGHAVFGLVVGIIYGVLAGGFLA